MKSQINHLEKNQIDRGRYINHKEFIINSKLISKTQQRFRSERQNAFTKEINKIGLNSNDDKRMKSIDSIEIYAYDASIDLVSEKEEIKCNNIIKRYKK